MQANVIQLQRQLDSHNAIDNNNNTIPPTPRTHNNALAATPNGDANASVASSHGERRNNPASTTNHQIQVLPTDTKVRINGDDITISHAYVNKHFYEGDELWYEIRTAKSVYTFPAINVHRTSAIEDNNIRLVRSYNQDYRYDRYPHQDDVSVTSTQQDEQQYHSNRQWRNKLMPNQFRFKLQADPITIQAPKMM